MRCENPFPDRAEHRGVRVLACPTPPPGSPRAPSPENVTPGGDNGGMTCEHPFPDRAEHRGVRVLACPDCRDVSFYDRRGEMPPLTALTELFGRYDLAGTLPVIGLPAREALAYAAPDPAARESLRAVPPGCWLRAADDLWLRREGDHILFAHNSPAASHLVGA